MAIIRYNDLIKDASDRVERIKKQRELDRKNGLTQFYGINRRLEIAERVLILLKKSQKVMTQDLFELNTELNHK